MEGKLQVNELSVSILAVAPEEFSGDKDRIPDNYLVLPCPWGLEPDGELALAC